MAQPPPGVQVLLEGNKRFIESRDLQDIKQHVSGQTPRFAVLCCSDSRVSPEIIFDADIGELFVVRVAGNVTPDPTVLASLEYAVHHLEVEYIVVMGHSGCGAVKAALDGAVGNTFDEIRACACECSCGDDVVCSNIKRQMDMLPSRSSIINSALEAKKLYIVGMSYNLENGTVEEIC